MIERHNPVKVKGFQLKGTFFFLSLQGSPVFQSVTKSCEYIFTWQTPAACPLKRVTGEGCQVSVPELSYQFDLNSLYNPDKDYEVITPKYKYSLNVCKKLASSSGSCTDVGGCQEEIANSRGISAGIANGNLMYDNGILRLNYTNGAACHDNVYERSMAINFVCDDTLSDNGHPVFIGETRDCTYQFEWATPLACAPFPQVECSYRGQDGQFDLAPLVNVDDNYEVSGGEENQAFYLTVCRSLRNIPGKKGAACPTNAAACLQTQEGGQTKYINLGEVTTGPTMEGDHLVLRYDSGDPCPSGYEKRSTVINFDCDPEAVGSLPEFQYAEDNCTYVFIWMNKLACQITHEDETGRDCKVSNPVTGFEFDLKVLQGVDTVNIFGHDQHVYNISICTALTDTPCEGNNIGACQSQRDVPSPKHFVTGKFNRQVFFDDGVLSLQYDDGTPCHNDNYKRSTVINFVCPHEHDTLGEPVFISETEDCTYYFSWHTSVACEEFIQCSVMNGTETIDLSPLVQKRGYYIAPSMVDGVGITFVNLCRPLNPIEGTLCPPNAAVCHMKDGKPQSLGRIDEDPQIGADGNVFIKYTNGEKCLEDAKRNISSIIQFRCQRGEEKGQPTLISYDNCTYTFEWSTYVVCPPAATTDGKGCIYRNDVMEYLFDLNALAQKTYKMNPATGKEVSLQLCGTVPAKESSECSGAAVCLKEGSSAVSLGQKSSQEFSFEGGTLRVSYSGGSACPHGENEKMETTILLRCIDSEESEEPTFFTADPHYCHTTLQWDTPIACPPQTMPCTVTDGRGALFDLQGLSQITGSWIVSSSNNNYRYFINVCKPAVNSLDGCPKEATVCREGPTKEDVETVGKIYTQNLEYEEADGKIILTYTEGLTYTCGSGVNRSGYKAKVRIAFSCSNKVGSPEFESEEIEGGSSDTCLVSFSWKSKVACKVKKAPVQLTDGKVTDPETGVELDLRPLLRGESPDGSWLVEGDDRSLTSNSLDQYQYFIMLADDKMEKRGENDECITAAVCQSKTDKRFLGILGSSRKKTIILKLDKLFFAKPMTSSTVVHVTCQYSKSFDFPDDTLELVTRNPASCRKDHSDVFSTVIFKCDWEQTPGRPKFLYESGNCQYFFIWETSHVCQLISNGGGDSGGVDNGTSKGTQRGSFGKVVLAFFMVVSICILVIVFHKRERRSAIYVRIRRCFPGSYANVPTYSYSQLSNGDRSVSTLEETRGLFDSDGEDEEILKETSPNPLEYKDDSDDDLLVDSRV
ncbi:putative cation-independent mannose-6-phosphate receptor-like [Apostichopus japonicus]|uniref:Putative cation-independent mannose-6-phosphate receptor-like n=1 Tax=Stichopus japonicus TaxID=307972 RepID=A0A2G8K7K2_STIJA|nr:putative cation-independent mannose-6-phosphate receptor-like [Apostichopus japonicus]